MVRSNRQILVYSFCLISTRIGLQNLQSSLTFCHPVILQFLIATIFFVTDNLKKLHKLTSSFEPNWYINPFAPGNFAKKHILKLVEQFSGHFLAIKSQNLPQSRLQVVHLVAFWSRCKIIISLWSSGKRRKKNFETH